MEKLVQHSDVLIEPFRPGVMERLGLGPTELLAINPKLIFARLSGFGQTGPLAHKAGHDINYVATSGILSFLGRHNDRPTPPINLLADFAGGGLLCAFGICAALLERTRSARGQVIDMSMTEGAAYVGSWLTRSQNNPARWSKARGQNVLDGGAFYYDTYETKDGKYMSVGAIETKFYRQFIDGLDIGDIEQFGENERKSAVVAQVFKTKSQAEWIDIYADRDACVFPVLDWRTAAENEQNRFRKSFVDESITHGQVVPAPAPVLSRTPAQSGSAHAKSAAKNLADIRQLLHDVGVNENAFKQLCNEGVCAVDSAEM